MDVKTRVSVSQDRQAIREMLRPSEQDVERAIAFGRRLAEFARSPAAERGSLRGLAAEMPRLVDEDMLKWLVRHNNIAFEFTAKIKNAVEKAMKTRLITVKGLEENWHGDELAIAAIDTRGMLCGVDYVSGRFEAVPHALVNALSSMSLGLPDLRIEERIYLHNGSEKVHVGQKAVFLGAGGVRPGDQYASGFVQDTPDAIANFRYALNREFAGLVVKYMRRPTLPILNYREPEFLAGLRLPAIPDSTSGLGSASQ
jgi:hypothetical protein